LRNEVSGQAALRRIRDANMHAFDLSQLKFPVIHEALCNDNVLVSEYVAGPSIDELLQAGSLPYVRLLELFRLHGFYMFCVGTFHGDLHPGNVLLRGDDFYFVDTGSIGTVSQRLRDGLFGFFAALAYYDYPSCVEHLHAMSTQSLSTARLRQFEHDFFELYADFADATVADVSLTTRMMQTIKLAVNAGMAFERNIFAIIRSLMYLDGMVLRCNPRAVLMRDMRPLLEEFNGTAAVESA
jgi:ubiquinone biosynthesis protein